MANEWVRLGLLCSLLAASACGGKASAPPPESAAPPAAGVSAAAVPVAAVRTRTDPNADLVVYLDGAGFRASAVFRALESAMGLIPGAGAERARLSELCGFDPILALEGVAVSAARPGGSWDEGSVIVALSFTEPPDRVLDCIPRFAPKVSPSDLNGRRALATRDGFVITGDGKLLLAGTPARVTTLLSQPPVDPPALDAGTYLHVRTNAVQDVGLNELTVSMSQLGSGTRLRISDQAPSAEAAAGVESRFRTARDLAKAALPRSLESEQGQRYLTGLLDAAVIERRGTIVSATVDLPSAEAEAAFTGAMSALAVYGVRRYVARAKVAEAHATVAQIAKSLAEHAQGKGKRRLPKSAPRTPKDVPAGVKFEPDAKTWSHASWKAIGFQREQPQRYSYEYETSPDGKRATVRAHGDLDGDGVTSRFELVVQVTPAGEVVIEPEIQEFEPFE